MEMDRLAGSLRIAGIGPSTGLSVSTSRQARGSRLTSFCFWRERMTEGGIEKKYPFIFALLSKAKVNESSPGSVQVELYNCSAFDTTRLKKKREELKALCKKFLKKNLDIVIMSETESLGKPDKQKASMKAAARNHPLVVDAQRIFDGEIINY